MKTNRGRPGRRQILAGAAAGTAAIAIGPGTALGDAAGARASIYPGKAFAQTNQAAALAALFGANPTASSEVKIIAPDIAENGAVVPVTADANMDHPITVAILARDNPFALAAAYRMPQGTGPTIASRIKLAKTTEVTIVYQDGGTLLSASKQVKVTLGGCG